MSAKQLSLDGVGSGDAAERVGASVFADILAAKKADIAFRLTAETLIALLRPALARELPATVKRVAGRNLLFDALAAGCGLEAPFTKSAAGQVGKAISEITQAFPVIDAIEILRVAILVRKKYENCGPMGISAHFHEFVRKHRAKPKATAPAGWLAKLNVLYADSIMAKGGAFEIEKETEYNWTRLDAGVRDVLSKALS